MEQRMVRPATVRGAPKLWTAATVCMVAGIAGAVHMESQWPLAATMAGAMAGGWRWLVARTSALYLERERLRWEVGVLARRHHEVGLDRIGAITVDQSLLGRLLRVGTLRVYTSGDHPEIEAAGIPNPVAVKEAIAEEMP